MKKPSPVIRVTVFIIRHKSIVDLLHQGCLELGSDIFPINKILEKVCQIVRALITEINVVGMFPNITTKQRFLPKT